MNSNLTELVFILDRSGSMCGLEEDTIGGYNNFIKKQKLEAGDANLTTVLFDDKYELLHDRINIKAVSPLSTKDYYVRGSTALLDAIGITINQIGAKLSAMPQEERPIKVLFVITTDGMENASSEYTLEKVRGMIEHQKSKYSWEFLFLGANIDAIGTASNLGIHKDRAVLFCNDSRGVNLNYASVSAAVSTFRKIKTINDNWKSEIEDDVKSRKD